MTFNYYYFVASLPVLDFESKSPISVERFLEECERLISPEDFAIIRKIFSADGLSDKAVMYHPVVKVYRELERAFRNEGVYARAAKWGVDPAKYARGERSLDPNIMAVVQQALRETDLIKAERLMDKFRWQVLTDLQDGHYFDADFVFIYAMKLKILERWNKFYSPVGREIWLEMQKIEIPKQLI